MGFQSNASLTVAKTSEAGGNQLLVARAPKLFALAWAGSVEGFLGIMAGDGAFDFLIAVVRKGIE